VLKKSRSVHFLDAALLKSIPLALVVDGVLHFFSRQNL